MYNELISARSSAGLEHVPSKHRVGGSNPSGQASFNIMSNLKNKINKRLDELEELMNNQKHLTSPNLVTEHIQSITKFWSVLSDEDKDYIECAKFALEKKLEWKKD